MEEKMRIELNSGGLGGYASIATMQSDVTSLLNQSSTVLSALKSVKNYTYNMNGGVGNLQEALNGIETHIQKTECKQSNLNDAKNKINSFIKLVRNIDKNISDIVNKNKEEFYRVNSWAKPSVQGIEGNWYEKVYSWVNQVRDSITDTVQKVLDSVKLLFSFKKEKNDDSFGIFQKWWKDHTEITPTLIEDDVFNSKKINIGYYGADQGRPANNVLVDGNLSNDESAYLDILTKNTGKEDFSEYELKTYLDKLNKNGCGYAALANIILEYYSGIPDGEKMFYEKFGFSMKKEDGNLNFDLVVVDLYSSQNGMNHNSIDTDSFGVILSKYMNGSGANIKVEKNVKVTAYNYDNLVKEGKQVVVMGWDFPLYYDENKSQGRICGGHGMIVTGVTESGLLIVSTWGGKAYIDPKDNNKIVTKNGKNANSRLTFQTVEIK